MLPAISQVCTLPASFAQDVADYSAAACRTVEVWLGKLETHLERHSLEATRALLAEHEVRTPVASFQGGLFALDPAARTEHWNHFRSRLELCRALDIQTIVVAGDLTLPRTAAELAEIRERFASAARMAAEFDRRLAFEFLASAPFANNLPTALALIAETGSSHWGICLDWFHFSTGPSKEHDLGGLTVENLAHVQVCDVADTPRELATDADRILPGDGDFFLAPLVETLERIGYQGCVSLEVQNPQLWRAAPRQFAEIGITALRRILGQASMD